MTVRQFSANWNPYQDRILLRFNTSQDDEYRLWLSRAMVKRLFEQASGYIEQVLEKKHDARVAALIQDFQRQKINQHINAGQDFQEGLKRPLGDDPVLVVDVKLTPKDDGQVRLGLQLATQKKVDVPLNFQALQSMVYLVDKLQIEASWLLQLGNMQFLEDFKNSNSQDLSDKGHLH